MLKIALIVIGGLVLTVGASASSADDTPQHEPLGTEHDCRNTCNDCQKNCQSIPAGSKQTDCMRSCTSTAAGCCAGYGKKPPQGLSCACM